jgi:rubredoxin
MQTSSIRKYKTYCRWCGIVYIPNAPTDRDGFCSTSHKQAHHRAYTQYARRVTPPSRSSPPIRRGSPAVVTPPVRRRRS